VFLFDKTVKIVNRDTYTSGKKAASYCGRRLAEPVDVNGTPSRSEIRMLEAAELAALKPHGGRGYDPVRGNFEWFVGDSGGSNLMKQLEGISGGYRVFQAQHGN
jgi:hypothetical protein